MYVCSARAARSGRACLLLAVGLSGLHAVPLGAQAGGSTLPNPTAVFSTPGPHDVTLVVCNADGCDTVTRTVVVLDPRPTVTSSVASPPVHEVGHLVRLTGTGTGRPPLSYSWKIFAGATLLATLPGADVFWSTVGLLPGSYSAVLRITNADGVAESSPLSLGLLANHPTSFFTIPPCRALDTRTSGTPLLSGLPRQFALGGVPCGIPGTARAVAANVTVVAPSAGGHVSLYRGNEPIPGTSQVSFPAGATRASFGVLPLSTDDAARLGAVAFLNGAGGAHLIVDITGYFLPDP